VERIVAICSTVVTRRTVCFISAATHHGLFSAWYRCSYLLCFFWV